MISGLPARILWRAYLAGGNVEPEPRTVERYSYRRALKRLKGLGLVSVQPLHFRKSSEYWLTFLGRRVAAEMEETDMRNLQRHVQDVNMDNRLVGWASTAMREKLNRGRDKGRSGWHNPEECSVEKLVQNARYHIDKDDGQLLDAAILLLMAAYRREHP